MRILLFTYLHVVQNLLGLLFEEPRTITDKYIGLFIKTRAEVLSYAAIM